MAPVPLFDTHAHLHDRAFADDLEAVIERARAEGVQEIVTIGTDIEASEAAVALAQAREGVWASVGVHPHHASIWNDAVATRLRELAKTDAAVAIGEIGLDFYRNLSPPEAQQEAFAAQLVLATDLGLPVVIHSREAQEETESVLRRWAAGRTSDTPVGVLHCFSGDAALAYRYVEMGFLISFAGVVTYPKNDVLREAALSVPAEHIVVETDCPYLTPQFRRGKRNEPGYVRETARFLAELRGESLSAFAAQTRANAFRLFRLPPAAKMAP